jgi:orotidine-5'-phosphate decarboxylase
MFEKRHGIIIACDVENMEKLKELVEKTYGIEGIVGYKIGANLALKYGLKNIMGEIDFCLPVIYDHQKAGTDIPQIANKFAKACREAGIKGVIIFPQAGPKSEEAFIDAIFMHKMVPMVGGEMTHEKYLYEEGGFIVDSAPSKIYEIAARKRVDYFILPGNKEEAIKKYHMIIANLINEPKYCMPGIGRQGGEIKKVFSLLLGYPSYAIVGSSIYDSSDIEKSAKIFAKEAMEFE